MSAIYTFTPGKTPILVSMPHSGVSIPAAILNRLTPAATRLSDTDWHIPRLYHFVLEQGHSVLQANYSRYVIDLNRPPDNAPLYPGQAGTGLCPETLFDGQPLYRDSKALSEAETSARCEAYWRPYHDKLAKALEAIKAKYGFAILYDAHSIASRVPRLFTGKLPDLNLGTADGKSCSTALERAVFAVLDASDYTAVVNGRFRGGYITRHYGRPEEGVHAVQMEINQVSYMSESPGFVYDNKGARQLQQVLERVFESLGNCSLLV